MTGTFPSPPDPQGRRRRPRRPIAEHSAGRILVVMLVGLVLAALVNADAMVERAERKPFGPGRDRSLAIWHPVQDVAHVLQLHRLRDLGDRIVGHEDEPRSGGEVAAPEPPVTTTTLPPEVEDLPPELRSPTPDDPLRVYIGGDSIVRDAGESFLRLTADDPLLRTTLHYEIATGLSRPDYYDWPAALVADAEAHDPEVMFVMFGGNDAQGIVAPDGTVHSTVDSPGWKAEYARRVEMVMDSLRADGRLVLWIGMPPVRSPGFQGRVDIMNAIYEAAAEERPWVRFVDLSTVLGDEQGRYVERKDGVDGALRQGDGIHLARPGADYQARHMLAVLREALEELAPAPMSTPTSPPATTSGG